MFSPSNGEKGLLAAPALIVATSEIGETAGESVFLPVAIRGQMPGRAMRGGAGLRSRGAGSNFKRRLGNPRSRY